MSFSRWGPYSDLYIFDHASYDAVVCLGCTLMPEEKLYSQVLDTDIVEHDTFKTRSLADMLFHITRHRLAGHNVPRDLEDKLEQHWAYQE